MVPGGDDNLIAVPDGPDAADLFKMPELVAGRMHKEGIHVGDNDLTGENFFFARPLRKNLFRQGVSAHTFLLPSCYETRMQRKNQIPQRRYWSAVGPVCPLEPCGQALLEQFIDPARLQDL